MNRLVARVVTLVVVSGCVAAAAAAQDTNYWTQQYGTRSDLLGGAVVGSNLDLSVTYYNPGALVLLREGEVLASANAFRWTVHRLEGEGAGDTDLSSSRFGTAPSLFTLLFKKTVQGGKIALVALTRQDMKVRLDTRVADTREVIPPPGTDVFAGENFIEQDMSENWFGFAWARPVRENIGFGVSTFVVYRGQRTRYQTIAQAADTTGPGASAVILDSYSYSHYRLLWKLGLSYDGEAATFGVAVTTPSIGLFGSGEAHFQRGITGVDLTGDSTPDALVLASVAEDLSTKFKSPIAVAAGFRYRLRTSTLHVSAEWFNKVDEFDVVDPPPFQDQITGEVFRKRLTQELKSVLNVGVGIEHRFREHLAAYGHFTTDFSASVPESETRNTVSTWDIYHVGGGVAGTFGGLDLTAGVTYSFGSDDVVTEFDLGTANAGNSLLGTPRPTEVVFRQLKMIIGFSFSL